MMRKMMSTALAITIAATSLTGFSGAAEARSRHDRDRHVERQWDRGDRHDRHHHRRKDKDHDGAAIAAGVIGLVLGAALASSAQSSGPSHAPTYSGGYRAHDGYSDYDRACAARYWSYNPADRTYLAVDGYRYRCTL